MFDIMKLKILFLLTCVSPKYIVKLFPLSILAHPLALTQVSYKEVAFSTKGNCISIAKMYGRAIIYNGQFYMFREFLLQENHNFGGNCGL